MSQLIISLLLILSLASCGSIREQVKQDTQKSGVSDTTIPALSPVDSGSTHISNNVPKEVSSGSIVPQSVISSAEGIKKREKIKNIKTLDDIRAINPMLDSMPGKNHPKFIELQKAQLTYGLLLSQISDPEYPKLQREQMEIFQGKAVWTQEMKDTEKEFTETLSHMPSASGSVTSDSNLTMLIVKRNKMMQAFQSSKTYQDYLESNKAKLRELEESKRRYYSQEILDLQKTIGTLSKEIYSSTASGSIKR